MRQLLIIGFLLSSLTAFAQSTSAPDTLVLFRLSENVLFANKAGVVLMTKHTSSVGLNSNGPGLVNVSIDKSSYGTYALAKFLNQSNTAYSLVSSTAAIAAFMGTAATAPTVSTIGTNVPTATPYNGSATITTSGAVWITVENLSTAAPTVTYAGATISMQPREQRQYYLRYDPTKGKYIPIAPLSVTGTLGTILVTINPTQ